MLLDSKWRQKIFFGGLLLLFIPFLGWPAALGYRKELIFRLRDGDSPLLPEWEDNVGRYIADGFRAMGVIFGYLAPLYLSLFLLLLSQGVRPDATWCYAFLFFAVFPIVSTLSFPLAIFYWVCVDPNYSLPYYLGGIYLLLFALIVFFIPAGFLQVSKTNSFWSALNIGDALQTLRDNFKAYVSAWYYSMLISLVGHIAFPFSPWGVIWCYLGIIYQFNSILSENTSDPESWYAKLVMDYNLGVDGDSNSVVRLAKVVLPQGEDVRVLEIGGAIVPLPTLLVSFLRVIGRS